jgi:BlaI family transcriptional regulator, penicillinase repressor
MARPKAKDLTERELEIMQVFWDEGDRTAADVRDALARRGRDLAYTTVATLIRILTDKGCLEPVNDQRPFVYRPLRTFEDVSGSMVNDLLRRVFGGSREQLLVSLLDQKRLTKKERAMLEEILREQDQ